MGGLKLLDGLRSLVVGMVRCKLMGVLTLRAQKRARPTAFRMWEGGEDSEPLLLFEELVSLPRWDRCKLMGVLTLRAQKRARPTALGCGKAGRTLNPCSSSRSLSVCPDGTAANSWRFSPPKRRTAPGNLAPGAVLRPGGLTACLGAASGGRVCFEGKANSCLARSRGWGMRCGNSWGFSPSGHRSGTDRRPVPLLCTPCKHFLEPDRRMPSAGPSRA